MDPLFCWAESQRRKTDGIDRAAAAQPSNLELARSIAKKIASQKGTVTADDVGQQLSLLSIETGPWAGAIFKSSEWQFTGKWVPSQRVSNHGRMLRVWRLAQ